MNGIYNSKMYKKEMAGRIMTAREAAGLTRQQVADAIGKRMDGTFSVDVLKQWEYGTNRVRVDLIPLLCEILHVDTGYLFGEYPQFTRQLCDVQSVTGLSKNVAEKLIGHRYHDGDGEWPDEVPKDAMFLSETTEALNILFETKSFAALLSRAKECRKLGQSPTMAESVSQTVGSIWPYMSPLFQEATAQKMGVDVAELDDSFRRIDEKQKDFFDGLSEDSRREQRDLAIFNFQREATRVAEELIEIREVEQHAEEA